MQDTLKNTLNRMRAEQLVGTKTHRVGPGQYSHVSIHKQLTQSRYTGSMLRAIRRDPNKR